TYNATSYPPPVVPYGSYGQPYRGQPSIVYAVPFQIGATASVASVQAYLGYGDVDGATGALHPPDATITTDTPGSGASRLQIIAGSPGDIIQLQARPDFDRIPPSAPQSLSIAKTTSSGATIEFVAPGGDGMTGVAAGYEIRYRAGDEMTPD